MSGATNLLAWVLGVPTAGSGLFWLINKSKGRTPGKAVRLSDNTIAISFDSETLIVPLEVMRLFQDVAVRSAAQKVVEEPLTKEGVDTLKVIRGGEVSTTVLKEEAGYFAKPTLPDEMLVDEQRRAAFSIISLAFKEDNKWRLFDGNTQINAAIDDRKFLDRVDANQIAFSKGDILICDVRVRQVRSSDGLKTDYTVVHVIEHRPAARQLPLSLE